FHFIISSLAQAEEIPQYAERWGVRSYKLYMGGYAPGNPIGLVAVDDGVFYRSMELIRDLGPYAYCMVHAENQGLYMLLTPRAHDRRRAPRIAGARHREGQPAPPERCRTRAPVGRDRARRSRPHRHRPRADPQDWRDGVGGAAGIRRPRDTSARARHVRAAA